MKSEEQRIKYNEYMRKWRKENPQNKEYQKKYHDEYYKTHSGAAIKRAKTFYKNHREEILEKEKALYHATKVLKGRPTGEANHNWKGDEVGYHGLHKWIASKRGKPKMCEMCGKNDPLAKYEWANKSGEYRRQLDDWLRLCSKCHWHYDQEDRLRGPRGRLI